MDGWALGISVVSLAVAVIGTLLSNRRAKDSLREAKRSRRTAKKSLEVSRNALRDVQDARVDATWASAVEAINRVYGNDPMRHDMQIPLQNLRVACIALVDSLPEWTSLGPWLAAEHARGAAIAREVIVLSQARPARDEDEHMELLRPFLDWGIVFSGNLRHLRTVGHDMNALSDLRDKAVAHALTIHERHGWAPPKNSLEPL